ncbi:MAG: clostripain-related cysteine peptidase [candidate division WOR-3 bacterium]
MRPLRLVVVFAVAAVSLLLPACKKGTAKAKWTILAYMDGNNNLDYSQNGNSFVIGDAQEMEKVGSTSEVQIVALLGSLKTGGNCKYYHIEKFENEMPDSLHSTVLENLGTKDMSDKQTLLNFIRYGIEHYPAEHYLLIIDDHGGGWRGACSDEQNGAGDLMSMPDIRAALDTFHFDVIVFHACLMSMVEVAYELKDNADYMVACQFTMPMQSILGSEQWLGQLVANPDMAPLDIAKKIVEAVDATARAKQKQSHMAVTDLSALGGLAAKIATLGNNLVTETGNHWGEVLDAFNNTHYTQYDDPAFVDLREFCKKVLQEPNLQNINLIKNAAQDVIDAINAAVPMTMTNVTGLTRGGLCIHFPYQAQLFDSANYVRLRFSSTNWAAFLSKFIASTGGGGGGGDKGWISVNSNPQGATIWYDGNNTGATTPAVIGNVPAGQHQIKLTLTGYQDWQENVNVTANCTTYVNATLIQSGNQATVSGSASWPGHGLSSHCFAFVDTVGGSVAYPIASGQVNQSTGAFTVTVNLSQPLMILVDVWDDVNGNSQYDPGVDGWGFWDRNGNNQWDYGDLIQLNPGGSITGVSVVLDYAPGMDRNPGLKVEH